MMHFVPRCCSVFLEYGGARERWGSPEAGAVQRRGAAVCAAVEFQEKLPRVELHNLYGPTEAAVHATVWECAGDQHDGVVPIGRPSGEYVDLPAGRGTASGAAGSDGRAVDRRNGSGAGLSGSGRS